MVRASSRSLTRVVVLLMMLGALLLLRTAAATSAPCTQPQLFTTPATTYDTNGRLNRSVLADLNGDGILDLVVAAPEYPWGSFDDMVLVMLGHGSGGIGDGTFLPPTGYHVGLRPQSVAVGDFDGDGSLDLAVPNMHDDNVSFLHGHGDGSFSAPVNFPAGPGPWGILARDLNQDGILDLVIANNTAKTISVLMGQGSGGKGNGTFAAPVDYPVGDYSLGLATGDLDGDGKVDLVATAYNHGVAILMGNGDGTFQAAHNVATGGQPYTLLIDDFDGDGHLDLAAGNQGWAGVAIFKGNGAGGFGAPTIYGAGSLTTGVMAYADFDGDGIKDLAYPNITSDNVVIMTGKGDGTFSVHSSYKVAAYPLGMCVADLNGDGMLDVVATCYNGAGVSVLMGSCTTAPPPIGAPHLVSVKDVPNDQGGKVFVHWTRSAYDTLGSLTQIVGYRVWRRLPPAMVADGRTLFAGAGREIIRRTRPAPDGVGSASVDYWEMLGVVPAEQLAGYAFTAPTNQDSSAAGNPYTAFFVTAATPYSSVFFESSVDSGYSVDNLAPVPPDPFTMTTTASGIALHWAASPDTDVAAYRIYRGERPDFEPGPVTLLATQSGVDYVAPAAGGTCFKVAAVDVHGNVGECALAAPAVPTIALALDGVRPNPATSGALRVEFTLPGSGAATVELFDVSGRRIDHQEVGELGAGHHSVSIGPGRPLSPGLYLVRLTQGARSLTTRAAVLR